MTWGTTKTIRLQPAATVQKTNGALKLGWAPYHAALSSWWLHQQTRNGRRRPVKLHKYICDFRNCGNSKAILLKSEFCKGTQEYSLPTYGYSKYGCSISNKYKTPVVPSTNIKKKELFVTPSIGDRLLNRPIKIPRKFQFWMLGRGEVSSLAKLCCLVGTCLTDPTLRCRTTTAVESLQMAMRRTVSPEVKWRKPINVIWIIWSAYGYCILHFHKGDEKLP